ncbi:hypothetical protein EU527_14490 [Candidatus Thorarchaeota archaeon]|nr:MAG: hypothetical protein EU527_14490 [Candidatus Thorarchaeota archaeon]
MRTMRYFNKTFALFIVSLFVVSFSLAGNTAIIPPSSIENDEGGSYLTNPHRMDPVFPSDQGTNLNWYTDNGSYNDTWTWSNNNWLFGPNANYEIFYNNGSQMDKLEFIPLNEQITWRVNIPKNILRGASLQSVDIHGWFVSPDSDFSADFSIYMYNYTPITWSVYSSSYNYSIGYESGPPYLSINEPSCSLTEDATMYYVTFRITFNGDTPIGLYGLNTYFYDTNYNWYDVKARWSSIYEMDRIAIGIPRNQAFSEAFYGGYTLEKEDLAGDLIYSISRETDFMMRFNITGNGDLAYAILWIDLSGDVKIPVNGTGYHNELVTKTGGWVYDPVIQTYVYNSSIQFSVPEYIWGDYVDYEYYYNYDVRNYEYRSVMYNDTTHTNEVVTWTGTDNMKFMYIYNFTSASFETLYGFTYWTYPFETYQGEMNQVMVFYEEPVEDARVQIYELNEGLSTTYQTNGVISVEFIGHFTKQAPKGTVIHFNDRVIDQDGFNYYASASDDGDALMTWQEYNDAKEIAVESPVTIAKLLRPDGSPVYGWFFPADAEDAFKVQGRLQGGADLASDIDGAIFEMKSYESYWTETSYEYTDMYYEIFIGSDKKVTCTAYNYTALNNYTYGYHWEWGYYLTTGWHYEYNTTTGETEWVYGDYYTYGDQWVEGWYWDWLYFNQKNGEWVSWQDWYYYDVRSDLTKVNTHFADISDITIYTNGGDLYYSFLVNLTDSVREITHYWDFKFANNTWVIDTTSEQGFHDIAIWRPGWIYSFDYMGESVYVDIDSKIGVFNSSLGVSDWLVVEEKPYITMNGVNYPIRVRNLMTTYSAYTEERILFYDNIGYYYELLNGTKIYINNQYRAGIYNVTISGSGWFLSTQKQAMYWYDGENAWYSWFDIEGIIHQGMDSLTWSDDVQCDFLEFSEATPADYYLRVGTSNILFVQDVLHYDSRTGTTYIIDLDGERYDLIYDSYYGGYVILYEEVYQRVSDVYQSYEATYESSSVFIANNFVLQEQWYTKDGKYEMPYPGANADSSGVSHMDTSYGGKVPTTKIISIGSMTYFLGGNPDTSTWETHDYNNHTGFWVIIDSTNYSLDARKMWHALVNGTSYWQPRIVGGSIEYGSFEGMSFKSEGMIIKDYLYPTVHSDENSTYFYKYNWRVELGNGTVFSCEPRTLFEVYLVDIDGTLIYTDNCDPYWEWNELEQAFEYYIDDLNGVRYYLDYYPQLDIIDIIIAYVWEVRDSYGVASYHYIVNGTEYIEENMDGHCGVSAMLFTNGTLDGKYFFQWSERNNYVYEINFKGSFYNATAHNEYIHQIGSVFGQAYVYRLSPIQSVTFKNFDQIIIGNPQWAMWGVKTWAQTDNNALDLDGDVSTTDDQYYILSEYQSTNTWSSEWSRMWVNIYWDPNGTLYGDEMNIHSWMGVERYTWSYEWQNTYYWYHADDLTAVDSDEWTTIESTIFNDDGKPRAGFWDISHMARNVTWEDIVQEAIEQGWDWFDQGEQTWTWLSFGVGQHYGVDTQSGWSSIDLRYEYSGLMLWEDTNNNSIMEAYLTHPGDGELTHYFIPDAVGSVSFVTPGSAHGVPDTSGSLLLDLEDEVSWGVTFHDVNGTTFPFNTYAYWDWYGGVVTGSDLKTFDERPTKVSIDEISFLVHFQGVLNTTLGATSNYATLKVDNTIGQWDVDLIGGTNNLEGKSLALNYLADVSTSQFRVSDSEIGQEETIVSDRFEIGEAGSKFAEMIIGGVTYEWANDPYTAYNVSAQTTPYSTFTSAYVSDNGQSATSWEFTSTQYYVSIGFPQWDGYFVYQDPVFVGYISNTGSTGSGGNPVTFSSLSFSPEVPTETDAVAVDVDIVTSLDVWSVDLYYSTDGYNFDGQSGMYQVYPGHYTGTIEPHAEGTQIWYKVVVNTPSGTYESEVKSYIVGEGEVIITTTGTTSTTGSTNPTWPTGTGDGLSLEVLMMVGGIGVVVVLLGILTKRRK